MSKNKKYLISIVIIIIALIMIFMNGKISSKNTYTFNCYDNKFIIATFDTKKDISVNLKLSDGRILTLPHVISGSGARYANTDESFVFWNKGTTAFITEGAITTFSNCSINTEYKNDNYNFSLIIPSNIMPTDGFKYFYNLHNNWRVYSSENSTGTPIVSFPIFQIDQGSVSTGRTYPLFFISEVRIGISNNIEECYKTDEGFYNQKVTDVNINGINFKKFSSSDGGMMKYMNVESYRTTHNNSCYVLEQIKHGSIYKDETMTEGVSEGELNVYYNEGENIIKTFKFIN